MALDYSKEVGGSVLTVARNLAPIFFINSGVGVGLLRSIFLCLAHSSTTSFASVVSSAFESSSVLV